MMHGKLICSILFIDHGRGVSCKYICHMVMCMENLEMSGMGIISRLWKLSKSLEMAMEMK